MIIEETILSYHRYFNRFLQVSRILSIKGNGEPPWFPDPWNDFVNRDFHCKHSFPQCFGELSHRIGGSYRVRFFPTSLWLCYSRFQLVYPCEMFFLVQSLFRSFLLLRVRRNRSTSCFMETNEMSRDGPYAFS